MLDCLIQLFVCYFDPLHFHFSISSPIPRNEQFVRDKESTQTAILLLLRILPPLLPWPISQQPNQTQITKQTASDYCSQSQGNKDNSVRFVSSSVALLAALFVLLLYSLFVHCHTTPLDRRDSISVLFLSFASYEDLVSFLRLISFFFLFLCSIVLLHCCSREFLAART